MKKLTKDKRGVEYALAINKDQKLIDNLFKILKSNTDNVNMKKNALEVLMNLLELGDDKDLEKRVLVELPGLLKNN